MKELIYVQRNLYVPKGRQQQNYKYRSIDDILESVKKIIPENCYITMADSVVNIGDRNYLCSVATFHNGESSVHATGYAWEPEKIAAMSLPQITGSCSSYARKTALCGLLMIDDSKDVDSFTDSEIVQSEKKGASTDQLNELKKYSIEYETSDKKKSDYISQALNKALDYNKAAEMLKRLKS